MKPAHVLLRAVARLAVRTVLPVATAAYRDESRSFYVAIEAALAGESPLVTLTYNVRAKLPRRRFTHD